MINPHVKFQVHMTKSQFKSLVLKFRPQVKSQVLTFNNLVNKLVWTRPIKFQL